MPPESEAVDPETREAMVRQLALELEQLESRIPRNPTYRRLTSVEYEQTLQDLLAISTPLAHLLPKDPQVDGSTRTTASLHLSPVLLERYLMAAEAALEAAIVEENRPLTMKRRFRYHDEKAGQRYTNIFLVRPEAVVFFGSTYSPTALTQFAPAVEGDYRIRISSYAYQSPDPLVYKVYSGDVLHHGHEVRLEGFFEAQPKSAVTELKLHLKPGENLLIMPHDTGHDFKKISPASYKGAGLAVEWVEVEGPLLEQWPPRGHLLLLGTGPPDSLALLEAFLSLAFRRPVMPEELALYQGLYLQRCRAGDDDLEALRATYRAILCSPDFLLLPCGAKALDAPALASRLSYFLWNSLPDPKLRQLADTGELLQPDVLAGQLDRLLADERSQRLVRSFSDEWLELDQIRRTSPDEALYPEFDPLLEWSMVEETRRFVATLLEEDLSLSHIVDSDFAFLNGRLARHYGIPGVTGLAFQRVFLPTVRVRGG